MQFAGYYARRKAIILENMMPLFLIGNLLCNVPIKQKRLRGCDQMHVEYGLLKQNASGAKAVYKYLKD